MGVTHTVTHLNFIHRQLTENYLDYLFIEIYLPRISGRKFKLRAILLNFFCGEFILEKNLKMWKISNIRNLSLKKLDKGTGWTIESNN